MRTARVLETRVFDVGSACILLVDKTSWFVLKGFRHSGRFIILRHIGISYGFQDQLNHSLGTF